MTAPTKAARSPAAQELFLRAKTLASRRAVNRLIDYVVERRSGARTRGSVRLRDLGLSDPSRVWYAPSDWVATRRLLRRLQVGPADAFLDLGAGRGRVLIEAGRLPFGRVIGLELSERLVDDARTNLARHDGALANAELVIGDAATWRPPDDVTVVFMYCPFTGSVFESAIGNLLESADRHPRPLLLVYNYPFEHNFLLATGRMEVVDTMPSHWPHWGRHAGEIIVSYAVHPSAGPLERSGRALLSGPRVRDERWFSAVDPLDLGDGRTPLVGRSR